MEIRKTERKKTGAIFYNDLHDTKKFILSENLQKQKTYSRKTQLLKIKELWRNINEKKSLEKSMEYDTQRM